MVGEAAFEPATASTQSPCTTQRCDSPCASRKEILFAYLFLWASG